MSSMNVSVLVYVCVCVCVCIYIYIYIKQFCRGFFFARYDCTTHTHNLPPPLPPPYLSLSLAQFTDGWYQTLKRRKEMNWPTAIQQSLSNTQQTPSHGSAQDIVFIPSCFGKTIPSCHARACPLFPFRVIHRYLPRSPLHSSCALSKIT
jgi:hypothetical protein